VTPPAGFVPARPTPALLRRPRFPPVSTLRFPRRAHLRASAEFQAVFGEGSRVSGPSLRLHVRFCPNEAGARLGLTVSKRVDPRSVGRNRIRRILRETFRLVRASLPSGDYVILAKPEAKTLTGAALRAEFADLLRRAAKRGPLSGNHSDGTMPAPPPIATAPSDPSS
jgi:ribonuclease P protein component